VTPRVVLIACLLFLPEVLSAEDLVGRVIDVSEGDMITVLIDRSPMKVRLYGIDCPEGAQPFGTAAKHFTSEVALGRTVTVVPIAKDRHGRTVADVFLPDNRLLNHELVKAGFAWWFRRYALEDETLKQLEADARKVRPTSAA
jgi:micrococcal nuclease